MFHIYTTNQLHGEESTLKKLKVSQLTKGSLWNPKLHYLIHESILRMSNNLQARKTSDILRLTHDLKISQYNKYKNIKNIEAILTKKLEGEEIFS